MAADGELLFVGGSGPVAQRYKSRTEEWEVAGATFGVGLFSQTTGLADGRVLFTGGLDLATGQPTVNAALYDPIAQTTTTLTMNARARRARRLADGQRQGARHGRIRDVQPHRHPRVPHGRPEHDRDLRSRSPGTFTTGPTLLEARALHTSTTLSNGQVLIAGGLSIIPFINLPTISATAYRFNPATNSFGFPSTMNGGRFLHSAVALSNGKVLIAGGVTLDLTPGPRDRRSDHDRHRDAGRLPGLHAGRLGGTFATVTGMSEGRAGAGLVALPNGGALIAGGMTLALDIPNATFAFTPTRVRRSLREQQHDHADRLDGRRAVPAGDGDPARRDRDGRRRRPGRSPRSTSPEAGAQSVSSRSEDRLLGPGRVRAEASTARPASGPRRDFVDAYGQAAGRAFGSTRTALRVARASTAGRRRARAGAFSANFRRTASSAIELLGRDPVADLPRASP